MAILAFTSRPDKKQLQEISKEFGDYIKIVVDIERGIIAAGCRLHADCEKLLLENGSKQENLWGGGFDVTTGTIDDFALINLRPNQNNPSQEILDSVIRNKFFEIAKRIFV